MSRQERRRERLISLTQTEIMFVLAAAILILLFAKSGELTKAKEDLQESNNRIEVLEQREFSVSVAAEEENLDEEIIFIMTQASVVDPKSPDVRKQVVTTLRALITERRKREILEREKEILEQEVDAALSVAEASAPLSEDSQAGDIREKTRNLDDALADLAENDQLADKDHIKEIRQKANEMEDDLAKLEDSASPAEKERRKEEISKKAEEIESEISDMAFTDESRMDEIRQKAEEIKEDISALAEEKPKESQSKESGQKEASRTERLRNLAENAAAGSAAKSALGASSDSPQEIKNRIADLKEAAGKKKGKRAGKSSDGLSDELRGLKDEIGFVPCWLGAGKPRYYFAYDITYDDKRNRYKISSHRDMQKSAAVVQKALSGRLSILREYPRGWVSQKTLRDFGEKARDAKNAMYPNKKVCQLAASLNESATGVQVKFINNSVGFYPVYRQ